MKADVTAALAAGYSMKTIWAHLYATGRLTCRYETFTLHVKRYIRTPPPTGHPLEEQAERKLPAPAAATRSASAPGDPRKPLPPAVGGFTFNPTPKKEDLF